jgi:hypothetical protein
MIAISIIRSLINSYTISLLLFCNHPVFSIRIGSISNTRYIASTIDRIYYNIWHVYSAHNVYAVGWNCFISNNTCQLIPNYSFHHPDLHDIQVFAKKLALIMFIAALTRFINFFIVLVQLVTPHRKVHNNIFREFFHPFSPASRRNRQYNRWV